ncbi:K(+)-transporting ATPase subunit F [Gordonia hydrophobica]|uniref:K(+)-transporting ATPase subunit F n=1 Tax=Gordonia hydrophobica TaxID=40516 RepID=A0ABZ2UBD9_9ACTN|nr:K(+)-transporting ATPase subunit F [Gordonia hydrophobica]MBM7365330.1 K+-transporting ATPase KdpF subunit [Gordonia hydrophobica]
MTAAGTVAVLLVAAAVALIGYLVAALLYPDKF